MSFSFGSDQPPNTRSIKASSLQKRAEQGDANAQFELGFRYQAARDYGEALRWYRRAARQGNVNARFSLAAMYFDGLGVGKDYDEAAHLYGCPKPSSRILSGCRSVSYSELPDGAKALLKKLNCNVRPGGNYDYGSAVDLNGDGIPEYQFCCDEPAHGSCGSVIIGQVGSQWRNLSPQCVPLSVADVAASS